jgi:hypothetical protein
VRGRIREKLAKGIDRGQKELLAARSRRPPRDEARRGRIVRLTRERDRRHPKNEPAAEWTEGERGESPGGHEASQRPETIGLEEIEETSSRKEGEDGCHPLAPAASTDPHPIADLGHFDFGDVVGVDEARQPIRLGAVESQDPLRHGDFSRSR